MADTIIAGLAEQGRGMVALEDGFTVPVLEQRTRRGAKVMARHLRGCNGFPISYRIAFTRATGDFKKRPMVALKEDEELRAAEM
ncbi:hypothetical protein [Neorhizobium petrolearium]|uniref:hypothetical protein n=1 Tax=Neorhizobium petrolearium TaxID=515361 RepID=UPI003F13D21C